MSRRERTVRLLAVGLLLSLATAACTSSDAGSVVTLTTTVPAGPPSVSSTAPSTQPTTEPSSPAPTGGSTVTSTTGSPQGSANSSGSPTTTGTDPAGGQSSFDHPQDGVALPDGFVPHKLQPGEKAPQFVVVSFDGVGWHEKWQYWFDIGTKVPFRFTGFLSGTYMLSEQTKDHYHPPRHKVGASDINWNLPSDLPVEIKDLNKALANGDEIGTHFNGHFCGEGGGGDWNTADWNQELDQFFALVKNYQANNGLPDADVLNLKAADIKGERTPCLEGDPDQLYPALKAHGISYDSTFTKRGISWPKKSPKYGIWNIGMAEYPMHGTITGDTDLDPDQRTQHVQITMDYNFWYSQEGAKTASAEQSKIDSQQVLDTYRDMYAGTYNGNRAPLILGNHLNEWNHNAYSDAIANFVLETCGKPDTQCVPFRDLIAWMDVQDPAVLAALQNAAPELGRTT